MKQLLGHDDFTGISTYHYYDDQTKETHIEYVQDVQPLIDRNKALHNTEYQKGGIKRSWMHAASIPPIIQMKWLREFGVDTFNKDHMKRVLKLLDDPEYKYLKTGGCKLA